MSRIVPLSRFLRLEVKVLGTIRISEIVEFIKKCAIDLSSEKDDILGEMRVIMKVMKYLDFGIYVHYKFRTRDLPAQH